MLVGRCKRASAKVGGNTCKHTLNIMFGDSVTQSFGIHTQSKLNTTSKKFRAHGEYKVLCGVGFTRTEMVNRKYTDAPALSIPRTPKNHAVRLYLDNEQAAFFSLCRPAKCAVPVVKHEQDWA